MASMQGVCHGRVLVDCDYSIRTYLNLEKVVPAMVEQKLFTRKIGKKIIKGKDMELFLSILKSKPMPDFLTFLNVIQSLGREDKKVAKLMRVMSGSLKELVSTDQTVKETISSFMEASQEIDDSTSKLLPQQSQQDPSMTTLSVETDTHLADISTTSPVEQASSVQVKTAVTFEPLYESHSKPTTEESVSTEIQSTILPSQVPTPRQPSSHSVSHTQVLTDLEHAIRQHINLEKVIPKMVTRKVFTKKSGKNIVKNQDKELFLGWMKMKSLHDFKIFLEVLVLVGDEDKETRYLMKKMSGLVDQITTDDPEVQTTISAFIEATKEDSKLRIQSETHQVVKDTSESVLSAEVSETSVKTNTSTVDESFPEISSIQQSLPLTTSDLQPHRPPGGFIGDCVSRSFTHEGGMLYLSEHGVTVNIPSGAVPVGERFVMSIHVYLGGPFLLPENVEPCSAVVWFGVQPPVEFLKYISVKIPHAAVVEAEPQDGSQTDALCSVSNLAVYRTPKEGTGLKQVNRVYQLMERIPGDFEDGYHAVFKVRHFSPYLVGKENDSEKSSSCSESKEASSGLHVVESRKQLKGNMSQRLRSCSSGSEGQRSFDDSVATGNSSPICMAALKDDPNVQFTTPPLSASTSSNVTNKSSSTQSSRHTSGAVGGKRLLTKKKKSSKSKRRCSGIKFCIALCTPRDRSMAEWEATFIISYNHPTGISALRRYALHQYHGQAVDLSNPVGIRFTDDTLELTPSEWTSDDQLWTVSANQPPKLFTEDVLMQLPSKALLETDSEAVLPHVRYTIKSSDPLPSTCLKKEISVLGAVNQVRESVFFILKSTSPKTTEKGMHVSPSTLFATRRILHLNLYLYNQTSDILVALHSLSDVLLDLRNPDHVKFLANLTLELACIDARVLIQCLQTFFQFEEHHHALIYSGDRHKMFEAIYDILSTWVVRNGSGAKLSQLMVRLNRSNIFVCHSDQVSVCNNPNILIDPQFDSLAIPNAPFLLMVSEKIQAFWKLVGRLMGIQENQLDAAEQRDVFNINEQSYCMLMEWQRCHGNNATCGVLFRAVQCLWDHSPWVVRADDVRCYLASQAEKMLIQQQSMHASVFSN